MYCQSCGASHSDAATFCPACGKPLAGRAHAGPGVPASAAPSPSATPSVVRGTWSGVAAVAEKHYAGFWLRFLARLIDSVAFSVVLFFILVIIAAVLAGLSAAGGPGSMSEDELGILLGVLFYAIYIPGWWLYYSLMESSRWQATLGKMALGLIVTDLNGNRLSFARATGRDLSKFISGMILGIGFFMAGFTEKKQALHDQVAGCLVVKRSWS